MGDPLDDFNRQQEDDARYFASLPTCFGCGRKIQGEHYYDIHGKHYCEKCMILTFRKDMEDYTGM
jgi:hypothetical protein